MANEGIPGDDSPCVGCGLCCDGTLFSRVNIAPQDQASLERLGFSLFAHGDKICFAQPCRAAADGLCAIYDDRPSTCRKYRCALLERFERSETTLEEARAIIEKAFELIDKAVAGDASARHRDGRIKRREQLTAEMKNLPLAERSPIAEKLLAFAVLEAFLDAEFRKPEDEVVAEMDARSGSMP